MIGRFKNKLISMLKKLRSYGFVTKCQLQAKYSGGNFIFSSDLYLDCPLRCDGQGVVKVGEKVSLGYSKAPRIANGESVLQARTKGSVIDIGAGTKTSNNVTIIACDEICIGSDCQIGDLVAIYDSDFHEIDPSRRNESSGGGKPVRIGKNVWLGSRTMVLKGVTIGNNSVVAAGSIVTKSIPSNCLAGGVPAKVIRTI